MTMFSSTMLNLIVSIIAVGILAAVMCAAYLVAGGKLQESSAKAELDTPYDLERAA
jgi:Tfp pilus assembly protein PilE